MDEWYFTSMQSINFEINAILPQKNIKKTTIEQTHVNCPKWISSVFFFIPFFETPAIGEVRGQGPELTGSAPKGLAWLDDLGLSKRSTIDVEELRVNCCPVVLVSKAFW